MYCVDALRLYGDMLKDAFMELMHIHTVYAHTTTLFSYISLYIVFSVSMLYHIMKRIRGILQQIEPVILT